MTRNQNTCQNKGPPSPGEGALVLPCCYGSGSHNGALPWHAPPRPASGLTCARGAVGHKRNNSAFELHNGQCLRNAAVNMSKYIR